MKHQNFPTFMKLYARRTAAKERSGFDVMRTADCWLAAELADAQTELEVCNEDDVDWDHVPARWAASFELIRKGLNCAGWRANLNQARLLN